MELFSLTVGWQWLLPGSGHKVNTLPAVVVFILWVCCRGQCQKSSEQRSPTRGLLNLSSSSLQPNYQELHIPSRLNVDCLLILIPSYRTEGRAATGAMQSPWAALPPLDLDLCSGECGGCLCSSPSKGKWKDVLLSAIWPGPHVLNFVWDTHISHHLAGLSSRWGNLIWKSDHVSGRPPILHFRKHTGLCWDFNHLS